MKRCGRFLCGACACYTDTEVYCGCALRGAHRAVTLAQPQQVLLYLHKVRGASTADLAATMRVTRPVLEGWLTGRHTLPLWRLWVIACVLDTTVPLLLEELGGEVGPVRRKGSCA